MIRLSLSPAALRDPVSALLRDVAETIIMPRFRTLQSFEIAEKTPGEIVTCVDHEAEARLIDGLDALGLGARIIGEESAAQDPSLLDHVGDEQIWLIDPLDGTANYADGQKPFGVMIALVERGVPVAGWIFDPVTGRLCHAVRGEGATIDGKALLIRISDRERPIAALATQFLSVELRERVHAAASEAFDLVPIPRCAAAHYPRVCLGENDIALFQRTLPWDHAAGALLLTEAGGAVTRWDGMPYRIDDGKTGLLAACDAHQLERAANVLLSGAAGLSTWEGPAQ